MITVSLMDLFLLEWEVNNTNLSGIKKYLGAIDVNNFSIFR